MIKRIIIIAVLSFMIFQGTASAIETKGEVLFRDSLYGAAIGTIIGVSFYMLDQDDFATKLASGIIVGTFGGLAYGVAENSGMVEIEKDKIRFAVPTPVIQRKDGNYLLSMSLLKSRF